MQIGELAERTGVSRRSIRYYEQKGLLAADRTGKGWREYDEPAVDAVRNIRDLLGMGLTVEDVQQVAVCLTQPKVDFMACDDLDHAVAMYEQRLALVDEKLRLLERHRDELTGRIADLRKRASV